MSSRCNMPDFFLNDVLSTEQVIFFHQYGFIRFRNFISPDTVNEFISESQRIEKCLINEGIETVNGIPLKFGVNTNGEKMITRFAFLSQYSDMFHNFLEDPRLHLLLDLLLPFKGRIGENEKDGMVMNHYISTPGNGFTKMGWHTDSPRDLFLGQKIMPMLNVGLHLDDCAFINGGLRFIPGSHKQGIVKLLFGKKYFIDNRIDPREVGFDVSAGDLTVHHGSIWHRVQQSSLTGEASRRRVIYIPVVTGRYQPKSPHSKTPLYHKIIKRVSK